MPLDWLQIDVESEFDPEVVEANEALIRCVRASDQQGLTSLREVPCQPVAGLPILGVIRVESHAQQPRPLLVDGGIDKPIMRLL